VNARPGRPAVLAVLERPVKGDVERRQVVRTHRGPVDARSAQFEYTTSMMGKYQPRFDLKLDLNDCCDSIYKCKDWI